MPESSRPPHRPWLDDDVPHTERVPETGVVRMVRDEITSHQTDITERVPAAGREAVLDRALLTIISGPDAGRVFQLDAAKTVIGRSKSADFVIQDPGISRHHTRLLKWMGVTVIVEDLGSSNGTFVNGEKVARQPLRPGDRLQLGPNVVLRYSAVDGEEASLQHQLYQGSKRDALTGVYNRAHVDEQLDKEVAYASRHRTALSIVMVDIDHFKALNDSHGHQAGDLVLARVGAVLSATCRTEDLVARYGGEEFMVVLRGTTRDRAAILADRLREAVSGIRLLSDRGEPLATTISAGVASLDELEGTAAPELLVQLADRRLYRAKRLGRDRICAES